jgi:hypothetical protein
MGPIFFAILATLPPSDPALLDVYELTAYHADEVNLPAQVRALALCDGRLVPVTVAVARIHDPVLDDEGEATGWELAAPCDATLLIRSPSILREGPVRPATERAQIVTAGRLDGPPGGRFLPGPGHIELQLGSVISEVVAEPHGAEGQGGFRLVLRERGHSVVLYQTERSEDGHWSLIWSGDLDGDGALDLVLEAASHYNVREVRVFLSRPAGARGPVQVGHRASVGC